MISVSEAADKRMSALRAFSRYLTDTDKVNERKIYTHHANDTGNENEKQN